MYHSIGIFIIYVFSAIYTDPYFYYISRNKVNNIIIKIYLIELKDSLNYDIEIQKK